MSKATKSLMTTSRLTGLANRIGADGIQTPLNRSAMLTRRIELPATSARPFPMLAEVTAFTLTPLSGPSKQEQALTEVTFTTSDGRVIYSRGTEREGDPQYSWRPSGRVAVGDTWQARCGWSMTADDPATYELLEVRGEPGRQTLLIAYDWDAVKPQVGSGRAFFHYDQALGIRTRTVGWMTIGGHPGPPLVDTTVSIHLEGVAEIPDSEVVEAALRDVADAEGDDDAAALRRRAAGLRAEHDSAPLELVAEIAESLARDVEARLGTR